MYQLLSERGAIVEGHFILRSERHSQYYIEKTVIFNDPVWLYSIARELAEKFIKVNDPEIITGPETGGARLARAIAHEIPGTSFVALADATQMKDKRVAVVEDVIVTGTSLGIAIETVLGASGNVVGAFAIIKRSVDVINFGEGIGFACLSNIQIPDYDPEEGNGCPLCNIYFIPLTPKEKCMMCHENRWVFSRNEDARSICGACIVTLASDALP